MCISKPQNAHTTRYKVLKWGGKKGIRKKDTTAMYVVADSNMKV